ncbi:MAG: flippase-like protein [Candidatus Saccharibacteria bacterium]|nr:flippase-like protein [Candidatus Saccharibacteria bacterium]
MVMPKTVTRKQYAIGFGFVILAAIGLFGILPRFGDFGSSLQTLQQATPLVVLAAAGASVLAVFCSALLYMVLSVRRLQYGDTLLVQMSGLLINRVLPAGIGGLGLNYLYLRAHKHSAVQATTVVTLNNSIGFMGHILLALGLVALAPAAFRDVHLSGRLLLVSVLALLVVGLLLIVIWRWRRPQLQALRLVGRYYAKQPQQLVLAVAISFALTLSNVVSLWLCCQALGISLSFLAVFVVFTFGIAVGTATPTPGGLGGTEAALVAALIAQHVSAPLALAVALLYRLVSYWLGLLIGAGATVAVRQRHLLRQS